MKYILGLIIFLIPLSTNASHILPYKLSWKTTTKLENLTIKSTFVLNKWRLEKIKKTFNRSKDIFFNKFEKLDCNTNQLNDLEVRLIDSKILRNKDYFYAAGPNDFGRYFSGFHTLYITDDMFDNPEYLAHELAHYFYDKCGVKFKNDIEEHIKVYRFQDFYLERH